MAELRKYNPCQLSGVFLLPGILFVCLLLTGCGMTGSSINDSSSFYAQRGHLQWPAQGEITESFGKKINPVYSTESYNPGILISTASSTEVKSVYDGEVTAVYTMPEFGRVVTISHGEYTSLYGNLSSLHVEKGMKVAVGQVIGVSGTADEPKGEALFFAIFHEGAEADPEPWLASGNEAKTRTTTRTSGGASGW